MIQNTQLTAILEKVSHLEKTIVATEAARRQAEDNFIEIAIAKMEQDEQLSSVSEQVNDVIKNLSSLSNQEIVSKLEVIRDTLGRGDVPSEASASNSETPNAPPPPPGAPAPPPPSGSLGSISKAPSSSSLMEQIRSGSKLKKLDVERLKEHSRSQRMDSRKSVMMVKSLEDTIRTALQTKFSFDEEEEEEEEW